MRLLRFILLLTVTLTVLVPALLMAQTNRPRTRVAIRAGRLLDVRTGGYAPNVTIVVESDRIVGVGTSAPKGVPVVDLSTATVRPGLIDAHALVEDAPRTFLRMIIANGVISSRDIRGPYSSKRLAEPRQIAEGRLLALRFITAGPIIDGPKPGPCVSSTPYGQNAAAGQRASVNGISMYYETYGSGPSLLLIHGNGGSIDAMRCQIEYFSSNHRVIAPDSRSHGKTDNGPGSLTYEQMADDMASLLAELKVDKVDVIGQSDGAILGLLLAMRHPSKVRALVASSPNLRPEAIVDWAVPVIQGDLKKAELMLAKGDKSQDWVRVKQWDDLMLHEPHIPVSDLKLIQAPVLIMGGDDDIIRLDHLLEMYRNIPLAQLCIVPGATHFMLREQHDLYNLMAERFLRQPFLRPTSKHSLENEGQSN